MYIIVTDFQVLVQEKSVLWILIAASEGICVTMTLTALSDSREQRNLWKIVSQVVNIQLRNFEPLPPPPHFNYGIRSRISSTFEDNIRADRLCVVMANFSFNFFKWRK